MKWIQEDIEFLKEYYPTEGAKLCAEVLDRSVESTRNKAYKLNIKTKISSRKKYNWQYLNEVPDDIEVLEDYINSSTKILHKHTVCNYEWKVKPNHILSGKGCPKCAGNIRKTHEQYLKEVPRGIKVLEQYTNDKTKILHKHKICGYEWLITPNDILRGYSCPKCAGKNANQLYYIRFPELNLYKIGITNNFKRRLTEFGYKAELISLKTYDLPEEAYKEEQHILGKLKPYLIDTGILNSGNTETFMFT